MIVSRDFKSVELEAYQSNQLNRQYSQTQFNLMILLIRRYLVLYQSEWAKNLSTWVECTILHDFKWYRGCYRMGWKVIFFMLNNLFCLFHSAQIQILTDLQTKIKFFLFNNNASVVCSLQKHQTHTIKTHRNVFL